MAVSSNSFCITCDVVSEYVSLANKFTQDLSEVLLTPMWLIFLSMAGLWIVFHGIKMALGQGDICGFVREFVFVIIAAALMAGQGPGLVDATYSTALSVMGGAASMVLSAGTVGDATGVVSAGGGIPGYAGIENVDGMVALVQTAEKGVYKVFEMSTAAVEMATAWNWAPILYGAVLFIPYLILIVVYMAQVVVSIFRVMMFAALSPILMLGFGFGWGRGMALTGLRTLFASFMVLFGATVAIAVCLYGVASLDIANAANHDNIRDILAWDNPRLIVAIMLGWIGTAFLAEATGMANSIANSQLTNQAAAVITAGAAATGMTLINPNRHKQIGNAAKHYGGGIGRILGGAGDAVAKGQQIFGKPGGISEAGQQVLDRINKRFDKERGK